MANGIQPGSRYPAASTGTRPLDALARCAMALELFLSAGALAGGLALILGPRGEIIPLPVSSLAGSPFDTYLVPGLILFGVLGLGPLVAVVMTLRRHRLAPVAAVMTGMAILAWLAVEIAIVGYTSEPPLQPIYLGLGVAVVAVGLAWHVRSARVGS